VKRPGLLGLPLMGLVFFLQVRIDRELGAFRAQREVLYLWSGQHVRRLFPGFEGLAGDLYWLRTVQYFGSSRAFEQDTGMELLGPLLDITVTLDPRMEVAYRYGAIFLGERVPLGAGRPQEALALLERGTRALPANWRIRQDLGFFYFLYLDDYQRAAEVLREASNLPGAAFWLKNMAADIVARGGDRATAQQMWRQIYEQSEGVVRANALVSLQVLDALGQAEKLTGLVEEFTRWTGRRPRFLEELRASGLLSGPAVDSSGTPFVYDAQSGRVRVSPRSTLYRPDRETP
jgi:tetratricopeptide (TPR) repeat protein